MISRSLLLRSVWTKAINKEIKTMVVLLYAATPSDFEVSDFAMMIYKFDDVKHNLLNKSRRPALYGPFRSKPEVKGHLSKSQLKIN